jgi:SAM-dependent methyltransferase
MVAGVMTTISACRGCGSSRLKQFLDLGETPLADALVGADVVADPTLEERFPLAVAFCPDCSLVQITEDVEPEKLFVENYLYFSSFSDHLLQHSRDHALGLIEARGLGRNSLVVELASNDGYLLKNFVDAGIPVIGFDPAPDQAAAAIAIGVPTRAEFFGLDVAEKLRAEGRAADVIIANNVMAHIPDPNDFVAGMAHLLADDGLITVENPSVWDLVDRCAFDTVYHEHFFYHSCLSVKALVERHGLHLNHVEYFARPARGNEPLAHRPSRRTVRPSARASRRRTFGRARQLRVLRRLRSARRRVARRPPPTAQGSQGAGQDHRGVRCRGQGGDDAQRHRDHDRAGRLRRRSQRPQARLVHARDAPADRRSGQSWSRIRPTLLLLLAWNFAPRSWRSSRSSPRTAAGSSCPYRPRS